jgi:hypothetical protein
MRLSFGFAISVVLLLVVGACGAAPVKAPPPAAPAPEPVPVVAPAPPPPKSPRQRTVETLLAEAEFALQQGRLTLPLHDNAYDRFQAVQLLDPQNSAAGTGLQAILLVYLDRVQQAMAANRLQAAAVELRQAQQYFPASAQLDALVQELRKRGRDLEPVVAAPADSGDDRVLLPPQPLSSRTEEVKNLLIQLAQRVRESDEAVIIHARSDAEGRWIYKTMRESVGEYRIRGDIRIVRQPAIVFQAPIREPN